MIHLPTRPEILFLQHSAGGTRGGERYTGHLHSFLKIRFAAVEPISLGPRPPEHNSIIKHALANLNLVKARRPALIVTDISSGARNLPATSWVRKHGSSVLLVIQERRSTYRYRGSLARWLAHYFEKRLISLADIILVNSQYIADYASRMSNQNARIIVCYPGLEITAGQNAPSITPHTGLNLLAVGECTEPRKGIRYLLEALPLLSDLPVKLHLAGGLFKDSPHFEVLREIIERHNLDDRVIFHGYLERDKLANLYRQTDIFALPSLSEGYGMALAEALSFGLPIVASNVAAIPEMAVDGVNALLVAPKDPQAIADAIRKLVLDTDLRGNMRRANLKRSADLPTWSDFDSTLETELVPLIERLTGLKAV